MRRTGPIDRKIPRILAIAGSDSGGGAGIQADLKTITALGGYAMSALTALTAQNTIAVSGIFPVPPDFVARQIRAVAEDIGVDAVKTGMLAEVPVVETVAGCIREYGMENLVADPVMTSKSGACLLSAEAESVLRSRLLPLAAVVTPNLPEAAALAGIGVSGLADMREAARRIAQMGPAWTVIKGGHMKGGSPVNLVYDGRDFFEFSYERIDTRNTHGTGCTFASAVATLIGAGRGVLESIQTAGEAVHYAIRHSHDLGGGNGPVSHAALAGRFL